MLGEGIKNAIKAATLAPAVFVVAAAIFMFIRSIDWRLFARGGNAAAGGGSEAGGGAAADARDTALGASAPAGKQPKLAAVAARVVAWLSSNRRTLEILAFVAASRVIFYVIAYMSAVIFNGEQRGIIDTLSYLWQRSDAPHYTDMAVEGYVTEGDHANFLVFLPFYPILVSVVAIFTKSVFSAGLLMSIVPFMAACALVYKIALRMGWDERSAVMASKFLAVFPASFFVNGTFSEGLFIFLSALFFYYALGRKWVAAGFFGMLAAFTRYYGVLLVAPMAIEYIQSRCGKRAKETGNAIAAFADADARAVEGGNDEAEARVAAEAEADAAAADYYNDGDIRAAAAADYYGDGDIRAAAAVDYGDYADIQVASADYGDDGDIRAAADEDGDAGMRVAAIAAGGSTEVGVNDAAAYDDDEDGILAAADDGDGYADAWADYGNGDANAFATADAAVDTDYDASAFAAADASADTDYDANAFAADASTYATSTATASAAAADASADASAAAADVRADGLARLLLGAAPLLLVPAGTALFLLVNYLVAGDPFQFLVIQREHWHQSFSLFFNNIAYMADNALTWDLGASMVLFTPQLVLIALVFALLVYGVFVKFRLSMQVYLIMYLLVSISASWLLSFPRYIFGALPVVFLMARASRNQVADAMITLFCTVVLVFLMAAYVCGNFVF